MQRDVGNRTADGGESTTRLAVVTSQVTALPRQPQTLTQRLQRGLGREEHRAPATRSHDSAALRATTEGDASVATQDVATPRIDPLWPAAIAAVGVIVLVAPPWLALPLGLIALVAAFARLAHVRIFLVVIAMMVPYAIGSYLGALLGITFYPWATTDQYWQATRVQLAGIELLVALSFATPLAASFDRAIHSSLEAVRTSRRLRPGAMYLAWIVTLLIAANDYRVLITNYEAIRTENRHNFDSEFIVAGGGSGILIALTLTCVLGFSLAVLRRHVVINAAMLALLWGPKLLAGNRQYTIMGIAICALLFFLLVRSRRLKGLAVASLVVGAVGFFFLPTLWSDNPIIGLNEWILPNTLYVSLQTGALSLASLGASAFFERWVMLIPPGLRPYEPVAFPDLFRTNFIKVGVGANPFADVYTGHEATTIAGFVAVTAIILAVGVWLTRVSPITIWVTFATMLIWGRSPFWETLAVIVDVALVTWPLFRLPPRPSLPDDAGPPLRLRDAWGGR